VSTDLTGRRVLVVGASEGIGRAFTERAVAAGASVVMAARRTEALADVLASAGGGLVVAADVCDDDSLDGLAAATVAELGEIDVVMYAVGSAKLAPIIDTDRELWNQTLATNVVGFNQLARRIVRSMAPGGIVVALSSESSGVSRDGLAAYAAAKTALDVSIKSWQIEQPQVRWSCVAVGATAPTAFGNAFDPDLLGWAMDNWAKRGLLSHGFMTPDEVGEHLLAIVASALALPSLNVEHLLLRSPSPTLGTAPFSVG